MSNVVSRRGFLGLGLGLGASVGLASCGGFRRSGRDEVAGNLQVAVWGGSDRADVYQQALGLFESANPEATARLQIADFAPYFERLTTQAAAGNLPDLFWINDTNFGRYAQSDALLNLEPMLGDVIDVSGIGDAGVQEGRVGDGVFGLPSHYNGQAVLTNNAVLKERGVDFGSISGWDDLAAAGVELTDSASGFFGLTDPTLGVTQRPFEVWVRQAGAELFNDEGGLGFDAAVLADWLSFWQRLRKDGVVPDPSAQIETDWERHGWENDLLVTGRSAVRLASASHHKVVQELTDIPIGINNYPVPRGAPDDWRFLTVLLLCVGGNTASAEVTASLLDFLLNDTEAAKITKLSMGAPSSSQVSKAMLPKLNDLESTFVEYMLTEMSQPRRPVPLKPEGSAELNGALSRASEQVAYGRTSIGDAAETVIAQSSQYLKS